MLAMAPLCNSHIVNKAIVGSNKIWKKYENKRNYNCLDMKVVCKWKLFACNGGILASLSRGHSLAQLWDVNEEKGSPQQHLYWNRNGYCRHNQKNYPNAGGTSASWFIFSLELL